MKYIEVIVRPNPFSEVVADVIAAVLGTLGFDSFVTEADALKAYCPIDQFDEASLATTLSELPVSDVQCQYEWREVEQENWNEAWEQLVQFDPIVIGNQCVIHSPNVTQVPSCQYDILLAPRMSFGSGHHETTSQLLEAILAFPMKGKAVLDMGCGTAILAILAAMCGAESVRAIEIDDWVADNARDNVLLNNLAGRVGVECGDATLLGNGMQYDVILANINRNVLLSDMHRYVEDLKVGGTLMMSGFYEEDIPAIQTCAEHLGLRYQSHCSRNRWVVIRFVK